MKIDIVLYSEDQVQNVREFNERLRAGGASTRFPEYHTSKRFPGNQDSKIFREFLLALEEDIVRGAYILTYQDFWLRGQSITLAHYKNPVSEGIVNKAYSLVGIRMLTNALSRQSLLFALGMGSYEAPLPQMLKTMGWTLVSVPFYFKVNKAFHFFRNIKYVRKTWAQSFAMDVLALTGLGWIGTQVIRSVNEERIPNQESLTTIEVNEFASWADKIWNTCKNEYCMVAERDSCALNILYPKDDARFIRLKVLENGQVVGWALVLDTPMSDHKQFGNMRVGSIVDGLALPEDAFKVVHSATTFLERRGVDIIVSNQSHASWSSALKRTGFIRGPSNYILATSKKLTEMLHPVDSNKTKFHLNRGDGDGPINL